MTALVMGCMFFLPARTLKFWEAWVYMGIIFTCVIGVISYFSKHDPDLLERRMKTREKLKEQKLIIKFGWFLFLPTFIIPGFDKYYGWSDIPTYIIIIADIMVLVGYLIVIRVFKENSYTSRVVEVNSHQKVISSGPYAIVRHPMYSGILLMYGFTPIALGSYWALTGAIFLFILIIVRIFSEEKFLSANLEGYKEYLKKIKYRVIPGIF
ncbi:MAG: isoprenylcysteine carboxylmethyltransferase family protein [Bacteroidetes bacterium]|nr:isoprenylcysteine carboxylmethyltransferase family protein [Bacteroidota bacterium]